MVNKHKNYQSRFRFVQTAPTCGVIYDHEEKIAEVQNLHLCNVKFRPSSQIIIGETVKVPLFWRQYTDHEHPLRNAGVSGTLSLVSETASQIQLQVKGTNQDESILSCFRIRISFDPGLQSYLFTIKAELEIPSGKHWHVTYNPAHGELEFCNFWPENCFEPADPRRKKYQACYIRHGQTVIRIRHHHLETSDKNNILLNKGDCFYWLLEDENPVVEILSDQKAEAGICAYMWDTHFAYRVLSTEKKEKVIDLTNQSFHAEYQLYAIDRQSAETIVSQAKDKDDAEWREHPIYLEGLNTFAKTLADFPDKPANLWPWTFETTSESESEDMLKYEKSKGYDDSFSLAIHQKEDAMSRWLSTTLGPAFGYEDFIVGQRYRLSAIIRTENVKHVRLAIRLHRQGIGSIFDISTYDLYLSTQELSGTHDWQRMEVITPPISPKPDRMHLILEQSGAGKSWFDNVLLERI